MTWSCSHDCAGLGRAQVSRKDMFRLQSGIAFKLEQPVFRTIPCNGILYGSVMAQNLPSLVAAHVLGPPTGSRVLDMCAAPGGKLSLPSCICSNCSSRSPPLICFSGLEGSCACQCCVQKQSPCTKVPAETKWM